MHPRNPYVKPPDFSDLAAAFPPFRAHLITTNQGFTIDFQNPESQRCLTRALLFRDFGLQLDLPDDRLCPALPNRLNYILWIQDIIASSGSDSDTVVRGIDMHDFIALPNYARLTFLVSGTGSSVIYPLLSCKLKKSWYLVGSEIDAKSRTYAERNVLKNNMQHRIAIFEPADCGPILGPLEQDSNAQFDFTMCNPPFYSSVEDIMRSSQEKELAPNGICTGAEVEMITEGGEEHFVSKMVLESLQYRERCRWYTSMLGKISSLSKIVALFREQMIHNYGITEFVQGKTRRWGIIWSFGERRLPDELTRISTSNPSVHSLLPSRGTLIQPICSVSKPTPSLALVQTALESALASVDELQYHSFHDAPDPPPSASASDSAGVVLDVSSAYFIVQASRNTWSRSARRARVKAPQQRASASKSKEYEQLPPSSILLECRVQVKERSTEIGAQQCIEFRWLKGRERQIYEGFCSNISRKVATLLMKQINEGAADS